MIMWHFWAWLDRRWTRWHARMSYRRKWGPPAPYRHLRLWAVTTVPLSTWIRQPETARECYERHLKPLLIEREVSQLIERCLASDDERQAP